MKKTNIILLIILVSLIIFIIINLFLKLLAYSFKAKKYGIKTNATIIGYYIVSYTKTITWYPVIKFNKINGEEVIAKSNSFINLPLYKVGEKIPIKYYASNTTNLEYKTIYVGRLFTKKENIYIDNSIKFNILDFKHFVDIILEILLLIILLVYIFHK